MTAMLEPARSRRMCCAMLLALALTLLVPGYAARATDQDSTIHHVVIQVTENDPEVMNLALNNVVNITNDYSENAQEVEIELVVYGPGLHMLRDDTSPVKARLKSIRESLTNITFTACGNTVTAMEKSEAKPVVLVPQVKIVKAGVVRVMQLQEQGWSYVRP